MNFRAGLIQGLAEAGYRLVAAAPKDDFTPQLQGMVDEYIPVDIDRSGMNPVTDGKLLLRYLKIMRRVTPAAFLGFTIKPNIYGSLAARLAGFPAINNISGLGTMFLGGSWKARLASTLYRTALRRSATVFFQNPDDRDQFLAAGIVREEQAKLIPGSGIDLDRFAGTDLPTGDARFLFIGRLLVDKGIREFVQAARLVREELPSSHFQILGGIDRGNRSAIHEDEVKGWLAAGDVEYLGEVADVAPYITQATAVALPSYREGMPRVLLEAAAMARPMIATDVPGCRSIVEHGVNGLLCAPRNAQSLADACLTLARLSHRQLAAMGAAARATVESSFSQRRVTEAYLQAVRHISGTSGVPYP